MSRIYITDTVPLALRWRHALRSFHQKEKTCGRCKKTIKSLHLAFTLGKEIRCEACIDRYEQQYKKKTEEVD